MSYCHCPLKDAAKDAPLTLGFVSKELSLSYQTLDQITEQHVQALAKTHSAGDLLILDQLNPIEFIPRLFAAWRLGLCIFPFNLRLPLEKREHYRSTLPQTCPIEQSLLLHTSGSTGTPKIAILPLSSLLANAKFSIPLQCGDHYYLSLPLFHVGGINILLRSILAKATITTDPENRKITHISYVPTQLYRQSPVYPNLKCILLGGAPLPSIPSHLPIWGTYGLTEMGSMVLVQKNPPIIQSQIFLGTPLEGRRLKLGVNNEIFVRGDCLFAGYLENQTIVEPFIDGWFATGDVGQFNPQFGFTILGRKDWQFISGGENIQPEEVEQALLEDPEILEAVVIPEPDPEFGMRPVALIHSVNAHLTLKQIQNKLQDKLPKYKIPIRLYHSKNIPKIGNKIDRHKIIHNLLNIR